LDAILRIGNDKENMIVVFAIIFSLVVFIVLVWPFLTVAKGRSKWYSRIVEQFLPKRNGTQDRYSNLEIENLRRERMRIYSFIADLNEDLLTGELTRDEYDSRFKELRINAAKLLQQEDNIQETDKYGLNLEDEIKRYRKVNPKHGKHVDRT
tara:strand:- start:94 stop:549 length:456 start_codon:yes stop_codon:yes gene_type:complete